MIPSLNDEHTLLLDVRGMSKIFGGSQALDRVDFQTTKGEIHALLGENGAGKSTLVKILAGVHRSDAGEVWFNGSRVSPGGKLPISFIHQDLGLVGTMTIAENVALISGYEHRRGVISWKGVNLSAKKIVEALVGAGIDVRQNVSTLTAAERSIVSIARALAVDAMLLVLDEPTASLPESDVTRLFEILRSLREQGIGMIYVTHRLDEVFRIADRVTVLRDGRNVATATVRETSPSELVFLIVGRQLGEIFPPPHVRGEGPILELSDVYAGSVGPVSFKLRQGEILGLVGLRGAGHEVIGRAIFGRVKLRSGSVQFAGEEIGGRTTRERLRLGIGFVTSKRAEEGLGATLSVRENIYPNPVGSGGRVLAPIRPRRERSRARETLERFDIRPREPERVVATLSGGNQQKVLLARVIELGSRLLVLEEPTFGVDVGAKAQIYATLTQSVKQGGACVLVSSDFQEVAGICDRALVFDRGRLVNDVSRSELTTARLTHLATGAALVEQPTEHA